MDKQDGTKVATGYNFFAPIQVVHGCRIHFGGRLHRSLKRQLANRQLKLLPTSFWWLFVDYQQTIKSIECLSRCTIEMVQSGEP
ncbi:hypothetical protein [Burkholderia gladioli]|uniref:hypothetical protein n=1 Tax=Burkholderia gladioli TaxID=28095 RepID=UPI0011D21307|nr:hypothetical protein [Burkholderia gladioli]MBW5286841.1 hypothetical protein [Burkholderia gladioli]